MNEFYKVVEDVQCASVRGTRAPGQGVGMIAKGNRVETKLIDYCGFVIDGRLVEPW